MLRMWDGGFKIFLDVRGDCLHLIQCRLSEHKKMIYKLFKLFAQYSVCTDTREPYLYIYIPIQTRVFTVSSLCTY